MNTKNDSRNTTEETGEVAEAPEASEPGSDEESNAPPPDGLPSRFLRALYYWTLSRM